ncbi:unnamed protein product [Arctogadus glacialis]
MQCVLKVNPFRVLVPSTVVEQKRSRLVLYRPQLVHAEHGPVQQQQPMVLSFSVLLVLACDPDPALTVNSQ